MNTPTPETLHAQPPQPPWRPEQQLSLSRARLALALREPLGLLLLQKILGHVGTACASRPHATKTPQP